MDKENIIEMAERYGQLETLEDQDTGCHVSKWVFSEEGLRKFARAVIKEERERIKGRVKEAAENSWCIKNEVVEEVDGELKRVPYSLYIGPSLNKLEEFVGRLLEVEK